MDVALSFHTTFVNGAITHFLRANLVSEAWCEEWDIAALQFWELELQRDLTTDQRQQFFLPLKDAGSGVQSAELRRAAAFHGSWELCLHDVAKTVGLSTAETVRARFRRSPRTSPRRKRLTVPAALLTPLIGRHASRARSRRARRRS